jgi:hypothetical protein
MSACLDLRIGYKSVGALTHTSVVHKAFILVLCLEERTFRRYGAEHAVRGHEQVLIGIIALFEWYDGVVAMLLTVILHLVFLVELVVSPQAVEVDRAVEFR